MARLGMQGGAKSALGQKLRGSALSKANAIRYGGGGGRYSATSPGGGGGGGGGYSAAAPYEPPVIDPVLNAASQIGAMQALMAVGLAGLPMETQEKYMGMGNVALGKFGKKMVTKTGFTDPAKLNKKSPTLGKKLMR